MTKILYAESLNEYVYLKSAQRKLNKHSNTKIKLMSPDLKSNKRIWKKTDI